LSTANATAKGETVQLMKRMGVKGHPYDPLPPDQHRWQRGAGEAPLHRVWSWMVEHTVGFHARREYAVNSEGRELHMEHMAKDLEIELANCYRVWKEGVEKGLWRNGEGAHKRKLYLCGSVRPKPALGDSPDNNAENCLRRQFQPYIWKQIKDWPRDRLETFAAEEKAEQKLDEDLRADFDAARRSLITQRQDTRYQRWGIKKIREEHRPKDDARAAEREARQHRVAEVLLPAIEPLFSQLAEQLSAQTIFESAHTPENGLRKPEMEADADNLTLLTQNLPEEPREARGATAGFRNGTTHAPKPSQEGQKRWHKYLPADGAPVFTTPESRKARDFMFEQLSAIQRAFRHADLSKEAVSVHRPNDVLLVYRLLTIIGIGNELSFCVDVAAKFKGLDRNSLAKLPSRSPGEPTGPRSFGLLLEWACDFRERAQAAGGGR